MANRESENEWQVWYQDTFDRETPRKIDVAGVGLIDGLVELWTRHLYETVRTNGGRGFARFNLWRVQEGSSVVIDGDWNGQVRLRSWVFGSKQRKPGDNKDAADAGLIKQIAIAHKNLILRGETSERIFCAAVTAQNLEDFKDWLLEFR